MRPSFVLYIFIYNQNKFMDPFKMPTETISLPSKGIIYAETNPLSSGSIEMKYMTAKEEDILTNINFIKDGTAIDKLLKSMVISPINFDDLILGDKNAILIAARILGYGKDYQFKYPENNEQKEATIDLETIKEKVIDESLFKRGVNEFEFSLPTTSNTVTLKILTHGDEKRIDTEIKALKKAFPEKSFEVTTRLKYIITSVNGKRDTASINSFVDNGLLVKDSRAIRNYIAKIQPDMELKYYPDQDYTREGIEIPIGVNFFWPDYEQ